MSSPFDLVPERRNTYSAKWDAVDQVFSGQGLLPFWVADMDFPVAEEIRSALQERVDHGVMGYTRRMDDFYDAVLRWCRTRYQWSIRREWITCSPGVLTGLALAIEELTSPGDAVMMHTPIYYPFFKIIEGRGRRVLGSRLLYGENHRFEMDFQAMEAADRRGAGALLLCNPHNPAGRVWTEAELRRLSEYALNRGLLVLSDDIHSDIVYPGNRYRPIATMDQDLLERTVTFISPSKGFNLAGLKTSVVIIPNQALRMRYNRLLESFHLHGAGVFGTIALIAAYTRGERWLEQLLRYLEDNLRFVHAYLGQNVPELRLVYPEGTFVPLLDIQETGMSDSSFSELLVRQGKVALEPGSWFGAGGERFVRINIATSRELLERCMEAIRRCMRA